MQAEHRNTAILLALLSIPFGVAIYKDATAAPVEEVDPYARYADDYGDYDDYDDHDDYDSEHDLAVIAALGEEAQLTAMNQDFFDNVFFDGGDATTPSLSGPIRNLAIGGSLKSISDAYPDFEDWEYDGIPGYDAATISLNFVGDTLHSVQIGFPDDGSTVGILSKQWGPGVVDGDSGMISWYVPSNSLRVIFETDYDEGVVEFSRFQTLEELIAPSETLFSFENKDIFLLTPDEVRGLPDYDYSEAAQPLPFIKEAKEAVTAWYQLEDDTVVEVSLGLALESEEQDRVLTLLKKKLGKGRKVVGDYETIHTFRQGKRTITWTTDESMYSSLSLQRN